jgi:hypothetical protein
MHRLRAGRQRHGDDAVAAQIAFLGCRRTDQYRFIAHRHMF